MQDKSSFRQPQPQAERAIQSWERRKKENNMYLVYILLLSRCDNECLYPYVHL